MSAPCGLGVLRELDAVLRRRRARARLDHRVGCDRPRLLDRDLEQLLALVDRQRPPLGDPAREPEHRVAEVADAVAHQRAVGVAVDVVAVGAAERRVQRVRRCRGGPPRRPTPWRPVRSACSSSGPPRTCGAAVSRAAGQSLTSIPEVVSRSAGHSQPIGWTLLADRLGSAAVPVQPMRSEAVAAQPMEARIVEAAVGLFSERGIDGTSLQMIADALGVTKGAVYYHFKTKQEIIAAVYADALGEVEASVAEAEAIESSSSREEALAAVIPRLVTLAVERRVIFSRIRFDPVMVRMMSDDEAYDVAPASPRPRVQRRRPRRRGPRAGSRGGLDARRRSRAPRGERRRRRSAPRRARGDPGAARRADVRAPSLARPAPPASVRVPLGEPDRGGRR